MSNEGSDRQKEQMAERFGSLTKQDTDNTSDACDTPDTTDMSETKTTTNTDDTVDQTDTTDTDVIPTREWTRKTIYAPDEFVDEMELTFDELNIKYRREHGEKLEKHADYYYPLLQYALEQLGNVRDRDLEEIEEMLGLADSN